MSYCRFQNTVRDFKDCLDALDGGELVSREEHAAAKRLIELAGEMAGRDPPESDDDED